MLHSKDNTRDVVLDLGLNGEKYSEFVVVLCSLYNRLTGRDLPVRFSETLVFHSLFQA